MMREIKFRFWDKKSKEMRIPVGYLEQYLIFESDIERHYTSGVLMQYTGLKDKNGVEIYEGDIISNPSGDGYDLINVIEFDRGVFSIVVEGDEMNPYYVEYPLYDWHKEAEIIGNIYENSELLEVEDERDR